MFVAPGHGPQHISHAQQLTLLGVPSVRTMLQRRLVGWLGHLAWLHPTGLPRLMLFGTLQSLQFRQSPPVTRSKLRNSFLSRAKAAVRSIPGIDSRCWAGYEQVLVAPGYSAD